MELSVIKYGPSEWWILLETPEQRAARSAAGDLTPHEAIFGVPVDFTTGCTPNNSQVDPDE